MSAPITPVSLRTACLASSVPPLTTVEDMSMLEEPVTFIVATRAIASTRSSVTCVFTMSPQLLGLSLSPCLVTLKSSVYVEAIANSLSYFQ